MKKVIGYIRCSTRKQAVEGITLSKQVKMIGNYCETQGLHLEEIITDAGKSGKDTKNRNGYKNMMKKVFDDDYYGIVSWSITRFGRNLLDTLQSVKELEDSGMVFCTVKENISSNTPEGKLQLQIYGSVAEYERNQITRRIKSSLQFKKENGDVFCRGIFGIKNKNGKMVKDTKEIKVRRRIKLLSNKGYSLGKIADKLNEGGEKTKMGGRW